MEEHIKHCSSSTAVLLTLWQRFTADMSAPTSLPPPPKSLDTSGDAWLVWRTCKSKFHLLFFTAMQPANLFLLDPLSRQRLAVTPADVSVPRQHPEEEDTRRASEISRCPGTQGPRRRTGREDRLSARPAFRD
ncbi:hypothetical protein V5799_014094 [Amblyomma americanum]|uniref:Uncharacterized protein n=1 Tax=Amblyomma americanum TaxID=6943 RepID=A0AAQ4E492_AMBAM